MIKINLHFTGVFKIDPDHMFKSISEWITEGLPESGIPNGFDILIRVHKNALTFNLIDKKDVTNIIEVITRIFDRIEQDEHTASREEFKEEFYFPFEGGSTDRNSLMIISLTYRPGAKLSTPVLTVERYN